MLQYQNIISIESLFVSWNAFKKGKKKRFDIQQFERNLEDNLFQLHRNLTKKTYRHDLYESFYVNDPKRRHIHKANVRDRVVHQALYAALYPIFDKTFIYDSYSCRNGKGVHRAVKRLEYFLRKESRNYSRNCHILHLDIEKFFASANNYFLLELIKKRTENEETLWLIKEVLNSFSPGLPLGNLTSQLFANVYLNELDRFVKRGLKARYYIRYCDDFVIVNANCEVLSQYIDLIEQFLWNKLQLKLHEGKIIIRKFSWGIDFLGYIILPHYMLPRTKTKRRVIKKLQQKIAMVHNGKISMKSLDQTFQSYLGYVQHAHTYKLQKMLWYNVNTWINHFPTKPPG